MTFYFVIELYEDIWWYLLLCDTEKWITPQILQKCVVLNSDKVQGVFCFFLLVRIVYALVWGEIENYWLIFYFLLYTHILLSQRDAFAWGKKKSDMSELVYLHANV